MFVMKQWGYFIIILNCHVLKDLILWLGSFLITSAMRYGVLCYSLYTYSKYILQKLLVNLITDRFVLPYVTEETHDVDPFTGDEP